MKRSIHMRSSGQGEIGLYSLVGAKKKTPPPPPPPSPPLIWEVIPRESISELSRKRQPDEKFLGFCYLCEKQLEMTKAIYMYGYLGAFCTEECRTGQMALDGYCMKVTHTESTKLNMCGKSARISAPRR